MTKEERLTNLDLDVFNAHKMIAESDKECLFYVRLADDDKVSMVVSGAETSIMAALTAMCDHRDMFGMLFYFVEKYAEIREIDLETYWDEVDAANAESGEKEEEV